MERYSSNNIKAIRDVLRVSLSNIIKMLSGILVGFLLPKIVGINDYGYYKSFTLYATYVGLFHFGFIDGIYLYFGGKDYDDLPHSKFRFYSKFLLLMEFLISFLLSVVSFAFLSGEYRFIFLAVSAFLFANNISSYYQFISQITSRFKELSNRIIIQSTLISVSIIILWIVSIRNGFQINYRIFTSLYLCINFVLALWYAVTYKDITLGRCERDFDIWKDIRSFFKLGFPLMVSNFCSSLILALDRQFVNVLFTNEVYAVYAFAYNMLAIITTAISAISTVLYPNLKKSKKKQLEESYSKLISSILLIVFACLIIYFPLCVFVIWFLPKYIGALVIFRLIFPGLAISSTVTIVMHNYYKAMGDTVVYFKKSLVVLIVSALLNFIAYYTFKTTISISVASVISMLFWYIYSEFYLIKKYKVKWIKNLLYLLILSIGFYLITLIDHLLLSGLFYLLFYVSITMILYRQEVKSLFSLVLRRK